MPDNPDNICREKTFKALYYKYAEEVRNYLFYKSGNLNQSEDLTQEAFTKLWENCAKVTIEKARAYLYTVARNTFFNEIEHRKVVLKFESLPKSDKDNQTPQFLLEEEEFRQRLQMAISELPESQRIVFLMNRIDKKKYREIAEELNISVKAVEKRMHKALAALRKIHKKV